MPKTVSRPWATVVYAQDSAANLLTIGTSLRQLAEMGLAVVAIDYNQTNHHVADRQFLAVTQFLNRQHWVDTNRMAWVGTGIGAQRLLNLALTHPELRPGIMVGVRSGRLKTAEWPKVQDRLGRPCATLLVRDAEDHVFFSETDALYTAKVLESTGIPTHVEVLGAGKDFQANTELVYRAIAEYTFERLRGPDAFANYRSITEWRTRAKPLWLLWAPAALWTFLRLRASLLSWKGHSPSITLCWACGIIAALAIARSAVHLWAGQRMVNSISAATARTFLIHPKHRQDFDALIVEPVFQTAPVKAVLEHVELADYNRLLVSWKVDQSVYRAYVLSPTIQRTPDEKPFPRRSLWEHLYPRIAKEQSIAQASEVVVRELRERITIVPSIQSDRSVSSMWRRQITDYEGFELLYVAALRAVGIPARLDSSGRAEIQFQGSWRAAPRPFLERLPSA